VADVLEHGRKNLHLLRSGLDGSQTVGHVGEAKNIMYCLKQRLDILVALNLV
jgi:hypothetical protein